MGVFDFLSAKLVGKIDWVDEPGMLGMRYPMEACAIQSGAQLTVRSGQLALFSHEDQLTDAFHPGLHTLDPANLPGLSALLNWDAGFASPFKADVDFFSQKEQTGLKWDTVQPITVHDRQFGPLRIRAFGSYSFRVEDVPTFAAKLMGARNQLMVSDIEPQLRGAIDSALESAIGGTEIAFVELAANQSRLSEALRSAVEPAFAPWGLNCCSFFVESLSLPEEVLAHLDAASAKRVAGDPNHYIHFQSSHAIESVAMQAQEVASTEPDIVAGYGVDRAIVGRFDGATAPADDPFAQVEKLHRLLTLGAITQQEYDSKKIELLNRIH
jgi:membrane protease subunit (stomatin/prohibitin family)